MRRFLHPLYALALAVVLAPTVTAAADSEAARLVKTLWGHTDERTLIVVHVDLTTLQPEAAMKQVAELLKLPTDGAASLAMQQKQFVDVTTRYARDGARDLFFIVSIDQLPRLDRFQTLVPHNFKRDEATPPGKKDSARGEDDYVIIGPITPSRSGFDPDFERPDLSAPFASIEGCTLQILLLPSAQTRRIIEEIMPALPAEFGGGTTRVLTQGIRWAALGVDLAPKKLDARLVIQSENAEAAQAFNVKLGQLLKALSQLEMMRQAAPKLAEVAEQFKPTVTGDRLTLEMGSLAALTALFAPPVEAAQSAAARSRSMNNLKQIMLGMFNYLDANKLQYFPPRALYAPVGKPLLSWRVQLLPWLDQAALYREFRLDEPWDSEHNRKLINRIPEMLRSPLSSAPAGHTTYLVPVVDKGVFAGKETLKLKEITDGTSNTIAVVEADDEHAVIWTKPDDIEVDLANPFRGLVNPAMHGFLAAFCDGSVRLIPDKTDPKNLGRYFMATDGEPVERLP